MKKKPKTEVREPLASPFEAAQVAISLAIMRGEKIPDIKGAIELLRNVSLLVHEEKRPRPFYSDAIYQDRGGSAQPPHPSSKIFTPDTDPVAWKEHIERTRRFPGADKIVMPRGERFTVLQIVASVTGRKEKKRNNDVIKAILEAGILSNDLLGCTYAGELGFWIMAEKIAPFAPRFKAFYKEQKTNSAQTKQPRHAGKFHKPKRTRDGVFKKQ